MIFNFIDFIESEALCKRLKVKDETLEEENNSIRHNLEHLEGQLHHFFVKLLFPYI